MKTLLDYSEIINARESEGKSIKAGNIPEHRRPVKPMTKWTDEEWEMAIPKKILKDPESFIGKIKDERLGPLIDLYFQGEKIDHRRNKDDKREYLLEPRSPYLLYQIWKAGGR